MQNARISDTSPLWYWPENLGQRHLNTRTRSQSHRGDQRHKGGGDSPPPLTSALAAKTPGIFPASGPPGKFCPASRWPAWPAHWRRSRKIGSASPATCRRAPAGGDERKFPLVGDQACNHESDETWGFKYQGDAGQLLQALGRTYQAGRDVKRAAVHGLRSTFERASPRTKFVRGRRRQ